MRLNASSPAGNFNSISISGNWRLDHFNAGADCELNADEKDALTFAYNALACHLASKNDVFLHSLENVALLFTSCNSLTLIEEVDPDAPSECTMGRNISLIVLPVWLWRHFRLSRLQMAAIILEEICHYAYCIDDETQVKQKVFSILQLVYPSLDFFEFFSSFPGPVNWK